MAVRIDESSLKEGLLGLVLALVEIIRDALKTQALRRMENGALSEAECERLGEALMELDAALEQMKEEQGVAEAVRTVRDGLDNVVDDIINTLVNPEQWKEKIEAKG